MALPGLVAAQNLADVVDRERAWDNLGSSVSANIPIASPSLDLNFARNKSLVDDISGNNLITFSRASTGTFVGSNGLIQTAASGVPRFDHNPSTGESLGLLVEEDRTNYQPNNSNNLFTMTSSLWTSDSSILYPDGNTVGGYLTFLAGTRFLKEFGPSPGNATYTGSVYAKLKDGSSATVCAVVIKDRLTDTIRGSSGNIILTNSWQRIAATGTTVGANAGVRFEITTNTFGASTQIYLWGAQVEAGSFPTSYIPTTSATVTRAADVASITGTNFSSWYRQDEGTVFCQGISNSLSNSSYWTLSNSGSDGVAVLVYPHNNLTYQVVDGGSIQVNNQSVATYPAVASVKTAAAIKLNNFAVVANGGTITSDTSGTVPAVTRFVIGNYLGGGTTFDYSGTIARITYYPVRLPDLALQYLTSASGSPSSTTYPYTFTIKGKDTLALNSVSNASARNFVFIKGLSTSAQPRITTAAQQAASGTVLRDAALLRNAPSSVGDYYASRGVFDGGTIKINGIQAASLSSSPFSGSTALFPISIRTVELSSNFRLATTFPSGTIASPERAIPVDTTSLILYAKAGQN